MNDKSFEWRMQGMIYACKMAKEKGIEYLEQDMKRRNVLKADIVYKDNQVREFWNTMSNNIYTNMLTTVLWVLHDKYGFRRERLHKFLNYYNDAVNITLDLDYMGEHFVNLEDYAVELNQKYNLGLDVPIVAACQSQYDKEDPNYRNAKCLQGIINTLRLAGYHDAADYLTGKMKDAA